VFGDPAAGISASGLDIKERHAKVETLALDWFFFGCAPQSLPAKRKAMMNRIDTLHLEHPFASSPMPAGRGRTRQPPPPFGSGPIDAATPAIDLWGPKRHCLPGFTLRLIASRIYYRRTVLRVDAPW